MCACVAAVRVHFYDCGHTRINVCVLTNIYVCICVSVNVNVNGIKGPSRQALSWAKEGQKWKWKWWWPQRVVEDRPPRIAEIPQPLLHTCQHPCFFRLFFFRKIDCVLFYLLLNCVPILLPTVSFLTLIKQLIHIIERFNYGVWCCFAIVLKDKACK